MTLTPFDPIGSLAGGALMGVSAALLLLLNGRVAGMSGLVAGLVRPTKGDVTWRLWFLAGLAIGAVVMMRVRPSSFESSLVRSPIAVVIAGVLVGFGTRLANGCTSGHGLCGIGRLSKRSVAATMTFIATGAATVLVVDRLLGGAV
jgi:uncharacterized membrane protein YedE/YeeE